MEWFQYPLPTYDERWLTSFICCGWAYGAIFCPLPPLELSQIWEVFWNYMVIAGLQLTPLCNGWGSNPTWNGSHISSHDKLQMLWLWMGIWSHHQANFNKNWEVFWNSGSLLGCKWHHCAVAEALTQHGMVPISPPNKCKMVDNLHMLWMGIWRHILPITITTTWVVPDLGSLLKLWFPAGRQMTPLCSCWRSNPTWNGFHTPSKDMKDDW